MKNHPLQLSSRQLNIAFRTQYKSYFIHFDFSCHSYTSSASTMCSVKSNRQVIFKEVPTPNLDPSKIFEIQNGTINLDKIKLGQDEVLVKSLYASMEPWMAPTLRDPEAKSEFPAAPLGEVMEGSMLAQVVKTKNADYALDSIVEGSLKWAEYSIVNPSKVMFGLRKIAYSKEDLYPLSYQLGIYGIPGYAAFMGLHKVCEPLVAGETLFISSAAGTIGQITGQYGKALGLNVIGSAGEDKKVEFLREVGFDAAFNYNHGDLDSMLKEYCPNGIDVYFDTVGGKTLNTVIKHCNNNARIVLCGMISQYYRTENPEPIYNLMQLIIKSIRMQGIMAFGDRKECINIFSKLHEQGRLTYMEDLHKGFEKIPEAFGKLLKRNYFGKIVVQIGEL